MLHAVGPTPQVSCTVIVRQPTFFSPTMAPPMGQSSWETLASPRQARRRLDLLLPPYTVRVSVHSFMPSQPLFLQALSTQTNMAATVCGTPFYCSPELIQSEPYREASDVWALGVLLFELLTLVRPFNGNNIAVLALNITKGKYASMARAALVALARSSSPCGHPPLEKPARLLRAALWAQEERPCRLAAEERLWRCARSVADFTALDHSVVHR